MKSETRGTDQAPPRSPEETVPLLRRLRAARGDLFAAEQAVADVVLSDPAGVLHMPIAGLAAAAEVSEGTVIRFCRSLGCKGYQAFKIELAGALANPGSVIQSGLTSRKPGDLDEVRRVVRQADIQAIEDTHAIQDVSVLQACITALTGARSILYIASGTSLPVAWDAYLRSIRLGLPGVFDMDSHSQLIRASLLTDRDAVLAVSHSGASRETVEAAGVAKSSGATVIALTARIDSALSRTADLCLQTVSQETDYREEAMSSRIAQLSLIDSIYVAIALTRPEPSLYAMRATSEALWRRRQHPSADGSPEGD